MAASWPEAPPAWPFFGLRRAASVGRRLDDHPISQTPCEADNRMNDSDTGTPVPPSCTHYFASARKFSQHILLPSHDPVVERTWMHLGSPNKCQRSIGPLIIASWIWAKETALDSQLYTVNEGGNHRNSSKRRVDRLKGSQPH